MLAVRIAFVVVLGLAIGVLVYKRDMPLLDLSRSRQIQTADITRNFYRNGIDLLRPQATYFGPNPVNFIVEFPLYNAVVANLYQVSGGVNEVLGRTVSLFAYVIGIVALFFLVKWHTDTLTAALAVAFSAYAPLHMFMARSFQPDELMLSLTLIALLCVAKRVSLLGSLFLSLAFLIKPAAYYAVLPYVYVLYRTYGRYFFLKPVVVLGLFIILIPSILWRAYASNPLYNPVLFANAGNLSSWISLPLYFDFQYWRMLFNFQYSGVVTAIGLLLIPFGLFAARRRVKDFPFFAVWLLGAYSTLILFQKHSMTHDYYHLVTVPIAAIFMALGYREILKHVASVTKGHTIITALLVLLIPLYALPAVFSKMYHIDEAYRSVLPAARTIQEVTPKDAIIAASSGTSPALLYYTDRAGWPFELSREEVAEASAFWEEKVPFESDTIQHLENLRSQGAQYFATINPSSLKDNEHLYKYLESRHERIVENEHVSIYLLK